MARTRVPKLLCHSTKALEATLSLRSQDGPSRRRSNNPPPSPDAQKIIFEDEAEIIPCLAEPDNEDAKIAIKVLRSYQAAEKVLNEQIAALKKQIVELNQ